MIPSIDKNHRGIELINFGPREEREEDVLGSGRRKQKLRLMKAVACTRGG